MAHVKSAQIALRLPVALRVEIEHAAAVEQCSVANMLRVLIVAGIEARRTSQTSRAENSKLSAIGVLPADDFARRLDWAIAGIVKAKLIEALPQPD
jgi:hypothetical protein